LQGQILRSLHAVANFITQHSERLPTVSRSGACQRLTNTIEHLENLVGAQSGGALSAMGLTRTQRRLRRSLIRDHMAPIATIARLELPTTPELTPLKMPRGDPSVARLTAHALGMAQAAEPFAGTFIALGRSPAFVQELQDAATALTNAITKRATTRASSAGATAGLEDSLRTGRRLVHVLDSLIQSELQDDSPLLQNWNTIKRVERRTGQRAAATAQGMTLPIRDPARLIAAAPVTPVFSAYDVAPEASVRAPVR
jgi:hypothetical protein